MEWDSLNTFTLMGLRDHAKALRESNTLLRDSNKSLEEANYRLAEEANVHAGKLSGIKDLVYQIALTIPEDFQPPRDLWFQPGTISNALNKWAQDLLDAHEPPSIGDDSEKKSVDVRMLIDIIEERDALIAGLQGQLISSEKRLDSAHAYNSGALRARKDTIAELTAQNETQSAMIKSYREAAQHNLESEAALKARIKVLLDRISDIASITAFCGIS